MDPGRGPKPVAEYSPVGATVIPQDRLQPIVRERARQLGAQLRPRTELVGSTHDDGLTATARRRGEGYEYRIRAGYLVAAVGANSPRS